MASMSGVGASDACVEMWEQLKAGKIKVQLFYVTKQYHEILGLSIQSREK